MLSSRLIVEKNREMGWQGGTEREEDFFFFLKYARLESISMQRRMNKQSG